MTIKIRNNVFETNSSSTHSISISKDSEGILDTIVPDDDGTIIFHGGEFGWEWERYNDPMTKANYLAVYLCCVKDDEHNKEFFERVIKDHTGAKEIIFDVSGYIDHQSHSTAVDAFESEETLKNFIFNPKSYLFTGNDNDSARPNFYDIDVDYKWQVTLENAHYTVKFPKKPTKKELRNALHDLSQFVSGDASYSNRYSFFEKEKTVSGEVINSMHKLNEGKITLYQVDYIYSKPKVRAVKDGEQKYLGKEIKKSMDLGFSVEKL